MKINIVRRDGTGSEITVPSHLSLGIPRIGDYVTTPDLPVPTRVKRVTWNFKKPIEEVVVWVILEDEEGAGGRKKM